MRRNYTPHVRLRQAAPIAIALVAALVMLLLPPAAGAATSNQAVFLSTDAWKYLDSGATPASAWTTASFNDAGWKQGAAELGAGDGDEVTRINRSAPRHVTDYFRKTFSVAKPTSITGLTLRLRADDGAVIFLNGTRVATDNMNAAVTAPATVRDGAAEVAFQTITLPAAKLVAGNNVIAIAVYQSAAADLDVSFAASLVAQTLIADPTTTTTLPLTADETATFQKMLDTAPAGSAVTVDRAWRIDGTVTVPRQLKLAFGARGMLYRGVAAATTRVLPVLVVGPAASGSRFTNLRIQGPSGCDYRYPTASSTFVNGYNALTEAQHGVDVRGGSNLTFDAPVIDGMDGDGFNVVNNAANVTINDAKVTCVGRNAVSATGATNLVVNRGSFAGAGLWVFDVEPFNANAVNGFAVTSATVGMSGGPWLNATGPDMSCAVRGVRFTGTNRTGASPVAPTVAACVAPQVALG